MLFLSLIMSAVGLGLLCCVMRDARYGPAHYLLAGGSAAGVLPCVCMGVFPGVFFTMAAGALAAVGWHYAGRRWRAALPALLAAAVVGHAIPFAWLVVPEMRARDELRREFVPLDVDARLRRPAVPALAAVLRLADVAELDGEVQKVQRTSLQEWQFARLHGETVEAFVNSPGFGVMRAPRPQPSREQILPTRPPIPQPTRDVTSQSRPVVEHPQTPPAWRAGTPGRSWTSCSRSAGGGSGRRASSSASSRTSSASRRRHSARPSGGSRR